MLISAEKRGRICDYVLVCPTVETVLKIANPWPRAVIEDLQNGQVLRETDRRVIELRVMPPKRYLLHQAGSNPRELPRVPFDFSDQAATAKEPRQ